MKQKGYTLLELLVALPIGAAILFVIVYSMFQIMQGRIGITQKGTAIADMDSAIYWLSRDLVLAQDTTLVEGEPPSSDITMYWRDLTGWAQDEGSVEHSASYTLSGNQLLRGSDGEVTVVARHITNVGFSIQGRIFTVTLTSQSGVPRSNVTRSFRVQMRSDLGP